MPVFTYATLDDPFGIDGTGASDINDKGAIVGYYLNAAGGHGFLYNGGVYTTLDRKSPPLPFQEWPLSRLDVRRPAHRSHG